MANIVNSKDNQPINTQITKIREINKNWKDDPRNLLEKFGKPVMVDREREWWGTLVSMEANITNLPRQFLPNAVEYRDKLVPPQQTIKVHVYEVADPEHQERIIIIHQLGALSKEQFETLVQKYGYTTSDGESHNKYGTGLRTACFALTKDRTLWVVVNKNGKLEFGAIGCIQVAKDRVKDPVYLDTVDDFIKQQAYIYCGCSTTNSTTILLRFDDSSDITAKFIAEEMVDFGDWNIEKGLTEIYLGDAPLLPKTHGLISAPVPDNVYKELIEWRDAYVKGYKRNNFSELVGIKSVPEIKLIKLEGRLNWMRVSACGFTIIDAFGSSGRSPYFYMMNWDFLINFVNSEKRSSINTLKTILDKFYQEVDKVYAQKPQLQPIKQDERLQTLTDDICKAVGLIPIGPNPDTTRRYRYTCPNPICSYFIQSNSTSHYTDEYDLRSTKPTEEEKKQLVCPHCGTELVPFPKSETEKSYCHFCEVDGLKFGYRTITDKDTMISHHTCLNPDHPHSWDTSGRVVSRKGLKSEEIHSTKFFDASGNSINIGVDSDVYIDLDLGKNFQLKKTVITPYIETYANYKVNNEKDDNAVGSLWKAIEMRMKIWEKSYLKEYKKPNKNQQIGTPES
jgi:hypothetical protein